MALALAGSTGLGVGVGGLGAVGGPDTTTAATSISAGASLGVGAPPGNSVVQWARVAPCCSEAPAPRSSRAIPTRWPLSPLQYGHAPATATFSATAFLRDQSPRPTTVAAADSALAAALAATKTEAAAALERVRVAALA
jgi:hypothetical protein